MLKFFPLLSSNLARKPVRTGLTLASILVAFMLFGLLKTLQSALELGGEFAGADRLITMHRMGLTQFFPRSYLNRIDAVDGVASVVSFVWFGGSYQDERNTFPAYAADPERFFEVYQDYEIPEDQLADWIGDRGSMIAGSDLAERQGWEVGDTVPVRSNIFAQTDGSTTWELRLAGIYHVPSGDNGSMYFHYDYFNESIGELDQVHFIGVRVENAERLKEVSDRVDALFANSPAETKTDTESAFIQGFANQMGDIGAIVTAVVSAVFFTILLVTGNTMAQAVRERTSELAVLKTLGYSSLGVSLMVLAEAFVIIAIGAVVGLGLAALLARWMSGLLQQFFPVIGMPQSTYVTAAVLVAILTLVAAMIPSVQAGRLRITDALRKV